MELVNLESGNREEIEEALVQDAFLSGRYGLDKGKDIPVFDPDGNPGYITSDNAFEAFQNDGFRYRTSEETNQLKLQDQYGDSDVLAAGLGAARGLSFGLSDVVASQLGFQEDIKAIKELNPEASLVGEVGSILVPALGQIGALRGAAAGVRAVQSASRLAGAEAMNVITRGVSNKIMQKALRGGVESAVESAFFSTGNLISEAAMGNIDFNAESVAPEVVKDVLIGGILGAGASAVSSYGGKAVTSGLEKIKERISPGFGDVAKKVKDINVVKKGLSAVFDVSEENIDKYLKAADRIDAMEGTDIQSIYNQTLGSMDDLQTAIRDQHNLQYQLLEESPEVFSLAAIKKDITDIVGDIRGKDIFGISEQRGKAVSRLKTMRDALNQAEDVKAISAQDMKSLIQSIDEDLKPYYERMRRPGGAEAKASESALIDLRRRLSERVKGRVEGYKDVVEVEAGYIRNLKAFQKLVKNENTAIANLTKAVRDPKRKADAKVLKDFGDAVGIDFQQMIDDRLVFESFEKNATRGSKGVNMGALPGAVAAGAPGAAVGALAGAVRDAQGGKILRFTLRQAAKMPELKSIEMAAKKLDSSIKEGVSRLVGKGAQTAIRSSAINQAVDDDLGALSWDDIRSGMLKLQADVSSLLDLTTEKTSPIDDVAPQTSNKAAETTVKAFQFLDSKMPKTTMDILGRENNPSPGEIRKFKKYLNAVRSPGSVIDQLGEGYVSSEGVEVLRNVYPSIYNKIQEELIDQMASKDKRDIPYTRLARLSNAFAAFGADPASLARIQATFNQANEEDRNQPISVRGVGSMEAARRSMTETDRIALGL